MQPEVFRLLCHLFSSPSLKGPECFEFITRLGSDGELNKWQAFKQSYLAGQRDLTYAGVQQQGEATVLDFEGTVFDIDYGRYQEHIRKNMARLQSAERYNDVLQVYLDSLRLLDFEPPETQYSSYISFSGMRTQVKWVCRTYPKAKVLCSLRSFGSYAISHINSRPEHTGINPEGVQEAWEHWYHKVVDAIYLKREFPDNIGLLTYEDMIYDSLETQLSICGFLGIDHSPKMAQPTIFGNPVRGNSWAGRSEQPEGVIYEPTTLLNNKFIPDDCRFIWDNLNLMTLNSERSRRVAAL